VIRRERHPRNSRRRNELLHLHFVPHSFLDTIVRKTRTKFVTRRYFVSRPPLVKQQNSWQNTPTHASNSPAKLRTRRRDSSMTDPFARTESLRPHVAIPKPSVLNKLQ
jgi:hypothetical protein